MFDINDYDIFFTGCHLRAVKKKLVRRLWGKAKRVVVKSKQQLRQKNH